MDTKNSTEYGDIYEALLARCPVLSLPPPWDFLTIDQDCRAPITDHDQTLAALRAEFGDSLLLDAGVVERVGDGDVYLKPTLCCPEGAIIALRESPDQKPFDILTDAGSLSGCELSVFASLRDATTREMLAEVGDIFATSRAREVVLLRSLRLPATLAFHLPAPPSVELLIRLAGTFGDDIGAVDYETATAEAMAEAALLEEAETKTEDQDATFGDDLEKPSSPTAAPTAAPPKEDESTLAVEAPSRLLFLGWRPLSLDNGWPPWLATLAAELADAERHLDLDFSCVGAWLPSSDDVKKLRYLQSCRNPDLIRRCLHDEGFVKVVDIFDPGQGREKSPARGHQGSNGDDSLVVEDEPDADRFSEPPRRATVVTSWEKLQSWLREDGPRRHFSDRGKDALRQYEQLVERDLIRPLQDWALSRSDPFAKDVGMQVADICGFLHKLTPRLHAKLAWEGDGGFGNDAPYPKELLGQYVKLSLRLSGLLSTLARIREFSEPQAGSPEGKVIMRIFPSSPLGKSADGGQKKVS